ncbi:MAG: hypothetical protein Q9191_001292 [Dirinaria sp. TL-2023a]
MTAGDRQIRRATNIQFKRQVRPEVQMTAQINNRHIFRDLFAAEFLRIYLPTSEFCPQTPLTWLQLVFNVPTEGTALDCAMAAVALSVVGRAANDAALSVESSRKYGQALWALQRALWDERLRFQDETLAACTALVLYELLECTEDNLEGWVTHAQGVARLVEARGPSSFDSPLAHMIFMSFRNTAMIQALQGRKASMFTRPEWQTEPWKIHSKGPDQQLFDIGIELSAILARADKSKSIQESNAIALEKVALLKDCEDLAKRLDTWFRQFNEDIPPPHYWPEFSNVESPIDVREGRKIFPVSFRFSNIYIAKVLIDYWGISIVLYSTSIILYRSLTADNNRTGPEHPADERRAQAKAILPQHISVPKPGITQRPEMIKSLADNIAQSMEYCLQKDVGTLGPQWALFALRIALQTYKYFPDTNELLWLQAIHDKICDEKGVKFSRIIAASNWEARSSSL